MTTAIRASSAGVALPGDLEAEVVLCVDVGTKIAERRPSESNCLSVNFGIQ